MKQANSMYTPAVTVVSSWLGLWRKTSSRWLGWFSVDILLLKEISQPGTETEGEEIKETSKSGARDIKTSITMCYFDLVWTLVFWRFYFGNDLTDHVTFNKAWELPREVRIYLEERCEDDSACVAKLEGGEQLRQNLVFTEVFRERVQIVAQILEELLLLGWLLDLERASLGRYYCYYIISRILLTSYAVL